MMHKMSKHHAELLAAITANKLGTDQALVELNAKLDSLSRMLKTQGRANNKTNLAFF